VNTEQILRDAVAAVESGEVPEDLRPAAFDAAVRLLVGLVPGTGGGGNIRTDDVAYAPGTGGGFVRTEGVAYYPGEAVRIINALSEARLLRTADFGAAGFEAAPSGGGAAPAGAAAGAAAGAPPDPAAQLDEPTREVGDRITLDNIRLVDKRILGAGTGREGTTNVNFYNMQLAYPSMTSTPQSWVVTCEFPPNEDYWLAEVEKTLASMRSCWMSMGVEVTGVIFAAPQANPPRFSLRAQILEFHSFYTTSRDRPNISGQP